MGDNTAEGPARKKVTPFQRTALGLGFGLAVMFAITSVFTVNNFDYTNIRNGVAAILMGGNPWSAKAVGFEFFNPPFSALFLWPLLFVNEKLVIAIGGAFLTAFIFNRRAWVAFSWFATNLFLWILAAGSIDMFVMGSGLLCLVMSDDVRDSWGRTILRVAAYGLLMIKPQGGAFIVALYVLLARDWRGLVAAFLLYSLPFIPLYPDWIRVILTSPPMGQDYSPLTILGQYGPTFSVLLATAVALSRPWRYWQLGAALASILSPYGMIGIPVLLVLTTVKRLRAIPIVVTFSWCLAVLTWVTPPQGVDYYQYLGPHMETYHMGMLGIALTLAIFQPAQIESNTEGMIDLRQHLSRLAVWITRHRPTRSGTHSR